MFSSPMYVTPATINPIKIIATPSIIHSIVIMFLLSADMSPNPLTTFAVGIRWATPHIKVTVAPI
jgi:hypothetical protein